jgi:hypothetical protein
MSTTFFLEPGGRGDWLQRASYVAVGRCTDFIAIRAVKGDKRHFPLSAANGS